MAYRYHGRARVDPESPRAWATCDRCGFNYCHYMLQPQYQYEGFSVTDLGILVCETCLDRMSPFLRTIVLPPDPPPLYNIRPEPYSVDEQGPTQFITAQMALAAFSIAVLYLDVYDADPAAGGQSVLSTLTGSSTRSDFATAMGAPSGGIAVNTSLISLVDVAEASADIAYLVAFDAPVDGNIIGKSPVLPQTVVLGNGLAINPGGLSVELAEHLTFVAHFSGHSQVVADLLHGERLLLAANFGSVSNIGVNVVQGDSIELAPSFSGLSSISADVKLDAVLAPAFSGDSLIVCNLLVPADFIATEDGDLLATEAGNLLITE